jgi:RNA polymerase sigma factor (sigma-70 family)
MEKRTCKELLNMEFISAAFKNNEPELCERIIFCLYSCYRNLFLKWATITYRKYPPGIIEFAANNSFTDGVLKLKESGMRNELYQGNASVKTVLFQYCRYRLLGHLKEEDRRTEKNNKLMPLLSGSPVHNAQEAQNEIKEKRHRHIMQALLKMPAADRQIIDWRYIDAKSNDEIAVLLAITVASATNRIYRCMQRLRELVEQMDKDN